MFLSTLSDVQRNPTVESSAAVRIRRLKRNLVASLFLRDGPFWGAVSQIRAKWGICPQVRVPCEDDPNTVMPWDKLPHTSLGVEDQEWDDDILPLIERFVPARLAGPFLEFVGACVMCDPPPEKLLEFAEYGCVLPRVFWPLVECDREDIDVDKLHSMVAPPIERVWKRGPAKAYEEGEQFAEYRIVVDEETRVEDVVSAFHAIKAAYGRRNPGGRPQIDDLLAIQCAVLHDDHNEKDPDDGRFWRWTYKKLASEFGLKSKRSAEEHVKRGRELRGNFRGT